MTERFSTGDFAVFKDICCAEKEAAKAAVVRESGLSSEAVNSLGLRAGNAAIDAMLGVINEELSERPMAVLTAAILLSFGWVGLCEYRQFSPGLLSLINDINHSE